MHKVVGIEEKQVFTPHMLHPHVARLGLSAVRFMNDAEAVVALRVFLGDASAAVCAAVVHQDGFPLFMCLRENAVESPAQVCLYIIYRYDDGNHGVSGLFCQLELIPAVVRPEPYLGLTANVLLEHAPEAARERVAAEAFLFIGFYLLEGELVVAS